MDVLKDILDNLNDSIIIINSFGQIVLYNNEAHRIQNSISEKPIRIGDHFLEMVTQEHKETVAEILKTIKRQKKPHKNFAEYNTPSGSKVFLEISFVPVLGNKRELKYINIITQDITSRKIFESKVRAVASDVKNLIENANAIILSVDSRGYIVEWNNHCAQLTGFSKNEIYCKKLSETLVKECNTPLFNDLMASVLKNHSVGNYELPIQAKDGSEIIVMLSATPRTNTNGQVIGATLVGQDITELTEYRQSLENIVQKRTGELQRVLKKEKEVVERKNRFVSIASHEFRTPLSSIDFASTFIKQNAGTIGSKKLNEKMEVIEKHVNHMSHLLEISKEYVSAGIQAGVDGYLPKDIGKRKSMDAIRCVHNGERYFNDANKRLIFEDFYSVEKLKRPQKAQPNDLTKREIEVLAIAASGKSNRQVGEVLFISVKTVETHKTHILEKLGLNNNAELIRYAIKNNLISI